MPAVRNCCFLENSFLISCIDMLSVFFGELILVRTPFFHPEMIDMFNPDYVVSSNVERYLPSTPSDSEAPPALLFADVLEKAKKPDEFFSQVLSAILRPGTRYRERVLKKVLEA